MTIRAYVNPNFSYDEWVTERNALYGPEITDTMSLIPEYQRLPGNIHIIDFLYELRKVFDTWLRKNEYRGEKIVLTPKHPDIIYPSDVSDGRTTDASPQPKPGRSIVFEVEKRSPASVDPPFGERKNWGFYKVGEVKGDDGKYYHIRMRRYESLVRFTVYAPTVVEAERTRYLFDVFMISCLGEFLKLGVEKMVHFDWLITGDNDMTRTGLSKKLTRYWFMTQEFAIIGPLGEIAPEIEAVVIDK